MRKILPFLLAFLLVSFNSFSQPIIKDVKLTLGGCLTNNTVEVIAVNLTGTAIYELVSSEGTNIQQSSNIFGSVAGGSYTVNVYDDVTQSTPVSININVNAQDIEPVLTVTPNSTIGNQMHCEESGALYITVTSAAIPFTLKITGNNGVTIDTTITEKKQLYIIHFRKLKAGDYNIKLTDPCGKIIESVTPTVVTSSGALLKDAIMQSMDIDDVVLKPDFTVNCDKKVSIKFTMTNFINATSIILSNVADYKPYKQSFSIMVEYPLGTYNKWFAMATSMYSDITAIDYNGATNYKIHVKNMCTEQVITSKEFSLNPYTEVPLNLSTIRVTGYLQQFHRDGFCKPPVYGPYANIWTPSIVKTNQTINEGCLVIDYKIIARDATSQAVIYEGVQSKIGALDHILLDALPGQKLDVEIKDQKNSISVTKSITIPATGELVTKLSMLLLGSTYNEKPSLELDTLSMNVLIYPSNPSNLGTTWIPYMKVGSTVTITALEYPAGMNLPTKTFTNLPLNHPDIVEYDLIDSLEWGKPDKHRYRTGRGVPFGNYKIEIDYDGCKEIIERNFKRPGTTETVSLAPSAFCGTHALDLNFGFTDENGNILTTSQQFDDYVLGYYEIDNQYRLFPIKGPIIYSGGANLLVRKCNLNPSELCRNSINSPYIHLTPGDYSIGATREGDYHSQDGHTYTYIFNVSLPPIDPMKIDVTKSGGVKCENSSTVDLNVFTKTGCPPFNFRMKKQEDNDSQYTPWQLDSTFVNVDLGIYTVQVKDSCNRTVTENVRVFDGTEQFISVGEGIDVNKVCLGEPLQFKLRNVGRINSCIWEKYDKQSDTWNTVGTEIIYTIPSVSYTDEGSFRVIINNGNCTLMDTIILADFLLPYTNKPIISGKTNICVAASSGLTLRADIAGSNTNLEYQWYLNGELIDNINSSIYLASSAGTYTVRASSDESCLSEPSDEHIVTITYDLPAIIGNASKACAINQMGTLYIFNKALYSPDSEVDWYTSINAAGPFTYLTTLPLNDSLPIIRGKYYKASVKEGDCEHSLSQAYFSFGATQDSPIISPAGPLEICSNEQVTLTATSTSTSPVYRWYRDNILLNNSGNTLVTSESGMYSVTVASDSIECSSIPTEIIVRKSISVDVNASKIDCTSGNATVTVDATGGSGTYEYSLDNSAYKPSNTFVTNVVGIHTVKVKDNTGCQSDPITLVIENTPKVIPANILVNDVSTCEGNIVEVLASSTGLLAPVTYRWYTSQNVASPIHVGNTFKPANLTQGTYTYYVSASSDELCENSVGNRKEVQIFITTNDITAKSYITRIYKQTPTTVKVDLKPGEQITSFAFSNPLHSSKGQISSPSANGIKFTPNTSFGKWDVVSVNYTIKSPSCENTGIIHFVYGLIPSIMLIDSCSFSPTIVVDPVTANTDIIWEESLDDGVNWATTTETSFFFNVNKEAAYRVKVKISDTEHIYTSTVKVKILEKATINNRVWYRITFE